MNDVVFLVEGKVESVQNGDRVDVIVVVVVRIDKGVPGVVDGPEQNVALDEGIDNVERRKGRRDELGTETDSRRIVQSSTDASIGPGGLALPQKLENAGNVEGVQEPDVDVAQEVSEGIPGIRTGGIDIVAVVVVFVVVVDVGFGKGTGKDSVEESNEIVVDVLQSEVFAVRHGEEFSVRVCLLVAQDIDKHKVPVHGSDSENVVQRSPPPDQSVSLPDGFRLGDCLHHKIGRQNDSQPDRRVHNEGVLGMLYQSLIVGIAPLVEGRSEIGQLEGGLIGQFPQRAGHDLADHQRNGNEKEDAAHKKLDPSRQCVGFAVGIAVGIAGGSDCLLLRRCRRRRRLLLAVVLGSQGIGTSGWITVHDLLRTNHGGI
mmetsp:Transcript_7139/g.20724  ORF Transcript_7139/g.20724 Transcript_7139/m.20724 type:complete len:372 (+) Transcript_7139:352-1467(+)